MRVLIVGAAGQLGSEVAPLLRHAEVLAADSKVLDVVDRDRVEQVVGEFAPDLVVNCSAFTDVDGAESRYDDALAVNALGVRHLAVAASRAGAHLVHVSTDYVFDGTKGAPYVEWDDPGPLSVYARSKLAGEHEAGPDATVVRTAWVYSRYGGNFVQAVLDRAAAGGPLRFIDDQLGTPTSAHELAAVLRHLAVDRAPGLFHATNGGATTRLDQARLVLAAAGIDAGQVEPMSSAELPWVAQRPASTVLDNAALRLSGVPALRHYAEALEALVKELTR